MGNRPDYLPKSCPPQDAIEMETVVYRCISGSSISTDDFIPHIKINPQKIYPNPCQASGLSVFGKIEDIKKTVKRFPKKWNSIATGKIEPCHGRVKTSKKDSHITRWHYESINPMTLFSIISN